MSIAYVPAAKIPQKKNKHGADVWVLLLCDNLNAHLDEEVKRVFGDAKVFCFISLQI